MFMSIDLTTKKWLLCFLSLLLAWWLLSASATCSASGMPEQTYQATEAELQGLEARLNRLAQISETQKQESKRLKDTLIKSEAELKLLKNQLNTSTAQLQTAQQSLANANQFLKESAAEEKRTRLRIKAQRNTWIAIAGCLLVALAVK